MRELSRSTGTTPLPLKFALALASVVAYAAISALAETLEGMGGFPPTGRWFHPVVGAIFGALVLGPYAAPDHRPARVVGLAAAGAAIYYLAVRFVVDGPLGYDAVTSFVLAGAGSAVLCAIAVVLIAPCAFAWPLVAVTLAAGAIGGAAFELKLASDPILLVGHAMWQLLVCLALHLGLRSERREAAAA